MSFLLALGVCFAGTAVNSLIFFVPLWGPRVVMALPAHRPGEPMVPNFSLADFVALFGLLAVANAAVGLVRDGFEFALLMPFWGAVNLLVIGLWIVGLRNMWTSGIRTPRYRLIFLLLLCPLSVFSPAGMITAAAVFVSGLEVVYDGGVAGYVSEPFVIAAVCTLATSALLGLAARRGFQRIQWADRERKRPG